MSSAAESFLYIWYDTKNKMFYLGKHKGTPIDSYTHSSTIMESFKKDNIPSHMKRRILAYGTDEEMCLLEHECLKNRKEKKWDRYYNVHVGDPRYVDQRGKNNPFYKHGLSNDPEWKKEYRKRYYCKTKDIQIEKSIERYYKNQEDIILYKRKYRKENPEITADINRRNYLKNRERIREQQRQYRARKKAERLASGATLPI